MSRETARVASFLDIPLGTVKSIIHRAREKLKALLPAEVVAELAAVQEVFNEHKLPQEFAMKVLEGLEHIPRWTSHMGCLEGCVKYLGLLAWHLICDRNDDAWWPL